MADETKPARRIDGVTLVVGILALLASAYVLTDGSAWLPSSFDLRWLVAGVAVLVGLLLLGGSLRKNKRR
ncbi:hypothetical protein [Actinokineospora enzanensis]|uniref:hypothetical protein n=1 Tax=Actinokineospora enzanensis TaxID=155975 RepID=UPI00036B23D4